MTSSHVPKQICGRAIPARTGEVRVCMVVRNEALRLPSTLAHYRALGVDRFLVIDNGSDDGTLDMLTAQADVHVFSTTDSYAKSGCGLTWTNATLDAFADGHWALTVDADEHFIYPHYEYIDIHKFCSYLDGVGRQAVLSLLLDMYSDKALDETIHPTGGSLVDTCPFFDPGPYRSIRIERHPKVQFYGGVRDRLFRRTLGNQCDPPTVSKVPLVKWRAGMRYLLSTHTLTPVVMAGLVTNLLHFKFLDDFHQRAVIEAERAEHFDNAREYRSYLDYIKNKNSLTLHYSNSVRFEDSGQLIGMGLMRTSVPFEKFASSHKPIAALTSAGAPPIV